MAYCEKRIFLETYNHKLHNYTAVYRYTIITHKYLITLTQQSRSTYATSPLLYLLLWNYNYMKRWHNIQNTNET